MSLSAPLSTHADDKDSQRFERASVLLHRAYIRSRDADEADVKVVGYKYTHLIALPSPMDQPVRTFLRAVALHFDFVAESVDLEYSNFFWAVAYMAVLMVLVKVNEDYFDH